MALIPLGVLSAAAFAPAPAGAYELIATGNGTGSSGVITFSSIPADYKHLQVRFAAKNSSTATQINITMNGITTNSYIRHSLLGNGSSVSSTVSSTSQPAIQLVESMVTSTTASLASGGVIDILDYSSSSKNTTIRALYGQTGNINRIYLSSGALFNTATITSLTFTASANNFDAMSRFSLYGIKG